MDVFMQLVFPVCFPHLHSHRWFAADKTFHRPQLRLFTGGSSTEGELPPIGVNGYGCNIDRWVQKLQAHGLPSVYVNAPNLGLLDVDDPFAIRHPGDPVDGAGIAQQFRAGPAVNFNELDDARGYLDSETATVG